VNRVRGEFSFWAEVDALPDGDPHRDELYSMFFELVENGPILGDTRHARWSFGNRWLDGYSLDLKDGSGFVGYLDVTDPRSGDPLIALLHLIWYDP
jgi:hypothetical protein